MPALGQVIWKEDTSDIQQGAMDTSTSMGVFTGANFDSVSQLSLALGEKEKELQKAKQDLAEAEQRHEQEIDQLKQEHEDRVQQWKNKVEQLKHQLENSDVLNLQQAEQIAYVNQQLKDAHLASKASSFLDRIPKDFKQVLC